MKETAKERENYVDEQFIALRRGHISIAILEKRIRKYVLNLE
jgi:hypothetical protein